MIELQFLGRSADGASLVFSDENGERYQVLVTDELRSAAARASLKVTDREPSSTPASPGQIQKLLRSGLRPHEVAEVTGTDVERVLRYYPPVEAEINLAIQKARSATVGPELDAPVVGDLVVDRLAARGIDVNLLRWSAAKTDSSDWIVSVTFADGSLEKRAQWTLTLPAGTIRAMDDVAAELTETVIPPSTVRPLYPQGIDSSGEGILPWQPTPVPPAPSQTAAQEALLDQLDAARGKPQRVFEDIEGLEEDDTDPSSVEMPTIVLDEPASKPDPDVASKKKRGRRSVPSWDEIVFGSRGEH